VQGTSRPQQLERNPLTPTLTADSRPYVRVLPPSDTAGVTRFRVLDAVPFEGEDESPFVALLQVEGA
jgi:hypothetical protein